VAGLSGSYPLEATLETSAGTLHCELYEDVAPLTVANFVGLARGIRPFKDPNQGTWVTRPAYDGSSFHRVVAGFMIQGGDPSRTGTGEPGYVIPDEIDESIHADHRGLLYMANRGPNTNGMQFFILDGAAPHIDGHYTAFGECEPSRLISQIANGRTDMRDHPREPVTIERVSIAFARPCP
jgi:peptidyl-prolyl cis-trans isomerase A (cyclophilin A)